MTGVLQVLHLFSSFRTPDQELRSASLINAFGRKVRHTIVTTEPTALKAIERSIEVKYAEDFPSLAGGPLPGRLQRLAIAMKPFDLVLSHNWDTMNAVMAHTVFRDFHGLPPLVHHEDGFDEEEAKGLRMKRNWYRRIALGRTSLLVVPSRHLETIALKAWQQPRGRVRLISPGVDTAAYARKPRADALPRVIKRKDEKWLGALAGFREADSLLRAVSSLPEEWQLVLLGEGPHREAVRAEAMRLDVAHRVHFPGSIADPAKALGLFDIYAPSSGGEQFPISVPQAMAAALTVISPDRDGISMIVSEENRPFIVPANNEEALVEAVVTLASDEALRSRVGAANRTRARLEYDEKTMISAYRSTYAQALRRPQFP